MRASQHLHFLMLASPRALGIAAARTSGEESSVSVSLALAPVNIRTAIEKLGRLIRKEVRFER
jgi:hypothetical protein